jgi:hypothetical protein
MESYFGGCDVVLVFDGRRTEPILSNKTTKTAAKPPNDDVDIDMYC